MAYNNLLANRVRAYLSTYEGISIEEKSMFGGLAFMVNGKMCVNVSGERLMCRFNPKLHEEIAEHIYFETMVMNGKVYRGYGYIHPDGFKNEKDLYYWIELSLAFNEEAKASKK